jgi:transcriptional regulator with XRE-family HTH domain
MPTPLLAAKLVELRNQHGLSQLQVAEFLGMSREGYSHYERSAREPSLEAVVRLSKLYGIDVSELVNEKTALLTENIKQNKKTPQKVSGAVLPVPVMIQGAVVGSPPNITANIAHFLKLFTGRNTNLDVTDITKEDIAVLEQYKRLDREGRKEVRQFIKFKHYTQKSKE